MRVLVRLITAVTFVAALLASAAAQVVPSTTSSVSVAITAGGQQLLGFNPSRRALRICNAGGTNTVWVCPGTQTSGTTPQGVVPAANAAGCFLLAPSTTTMNCLVEPPVGGPTAGAVSLATSAWNAIAVTGATPVTVWEY